MGCKSCGGAADPMSVYEIPPQPASPRPVSPQRIQGQRSAPTAVPTLAAASEPTPAPKPTSRRRRTPRS